MPRGAHPGERRGGRVKGSRNRHVIERELLAQKALNDRGCADTKSIIAKETISDVVVYFKSRAREAAQRFLEMARPGVEATDKAKRYYGDAEDAATRYMRLTGDYAEKLLGYQSPKLSHTTLAQPDPFESMSDEELQIEMMRRAKDLGLVQADAVPKIRGPKATVFKMMRIKGHQMTKKQAYTRAF